MHRYVDLGVHAFPEGADTPKRFELVARRLGFYNIGIVYHSPYWTQLSDPRLISGVEVVAESVSELQKKIASYRHAVTILSVHGGNEKINRSACRDDRVDILMHPESGKHNGLNQVTAKLAKKTGVAIGFSLDYFWKTKESEKSRLLAFQRKNIALCKKFGLGVIITSDAYSHYDLRAPRELKALARLLLLKPNESDAALSSIPLQIIERRSQM